MTEAVVSLDWQVYMIRCDDGSLYTGITTDVTRRFHEHASGKGARYFRAHRPEQVVYVEVGHSRSSASRRECEIKGLPRAAKISLAVSMTPAARFQVGKN